MNISRKFFLLISFCILCVGILIGRIYISTMRTTDVDKVVKEFGLKIDRNLWPKTSGTIKVKHASANGHVFIAPINKDSRAILALGEQDNSFVEVETNRVIAVWNLGTDKQSEIRMWDYDGKGILDAVEYDIVDNTGRPIGFVIDSDRDGEPDMKGIYGYDKGKRYLKQILYFISGRWYEAEMQNGTVGVVAEGKWREVEKQKRKFVFKH